MGSKSSKKNGVKNRHKQNKKLNTKNAKIKLEEQQYLNRWLEEKHITSQIRIKNFTDTTWDVVKASWKIILGLSTASAVGFLIWAIFAYICGDNEVATKTMTVMQSLSGFISVIVGIWALIITIEANRKESSTKDNLNINQSSSGIGVVGIPHENDVNPKSLE